MYLGLQRRGAGTEVPALWERTMSGIKPTTLKKVSGYLKP